MKNDTNLCACTEVITLEAQKCRKEAPHFVEFKGSVAKIETYCNPGNFSKLINLVNLRKTIERHPT